MANKRLTDLDTFGNPELVTIRDEMSPDQVTELWILAGQSNMVGYGGAAGDEERAPQEGLYMIDESGNIQPASMPVHVEQINNGLGTNLTGASGGLNALKMRAAQGSKKIAVLSAAVGGTGLHWTATVPMWYGSSTYSGNSTGGTLWNAVITRADAFLAANPRTVLRGVIWHQGENDAFASISTADYKTAFMSMIDGWKAEIDSDMFGGHDDLLVIIGQLTPYNLANGYDAVAASAFTAIDTAHRELVAENRLFSFAPSTGLTVITESPDNVHFDVASQRAMGRRYLAAIIEAELNQAGDKPGTKIDTFNTSRDYAEGTIVLHLGGVYQANTEVTAGAFTLSEWDTVIPGLQGSSMDLSGLTSGLSNYPAQDIYFTRSTDTLGTSGLSAFFGGQSFRSTADGDLTKQAYSAVGMDGFHFTGGAVTPSNYLASAIGVLDTSAFPNLDHAWVRSYYASAGSAVASEMFAVANTYQGDHARVLAYSGGSGGTSTYAEMGVYRLTTKQVFGVQVNRDTSGETHVVGQEAVEIFADNAGFDTTDVATTAGSTTRTTLRITETDAEFYYSPTGAATGTQFANLDSDGITLTNTDAGAAAGPILELYRNSASAADNDVIGAIQFKGNNDDVATPRYAQISAKVADASDTAEDGAIEFFVVADGTTDTKIATVSADGVEIHDSSRGLILTSADSSRWKITINNVGTLETTKLP